MTYLARFGKSGPKREKSRSPQEDLAERLLQGRAGRGEQLGAFLGDVHAILQAHPELATLVHPRLVAETHARRQLALVAAHQVRPFMAVHADAVAQAMREVAVVGTEARVGDDLARGAIHRFA